MALLPQFFAIEPRFVRKGCDRTREIAILPLFFFAIGPPVSCERVVFRAVSLALPRVFKRDIEKTERASKRARENVKM